VDNRWLCRELGREAQKWIEYRFNWDQMAAGYAEVFLEIAGRRSSERRRGI
jgi:hypothetical protein